jgi:toxin ParE1/3/4
VSRAFRVLPEAGAELAEAAAWYESQRPGLGVELVAIIDAAIARITASPEAWPRWRGDRPYRKHVVGRFPT